MKYPHILLSFVIVLLFVSPSAEGQVERQLSCRFLDEVVFPKCISVKNVFVSPSGREFMLDDFPHEEFAAVVSVDQTARTVNVTQRSRSDGLWDTGDKIADTAVQKKSRFRPTRQGWTINEIRIEGVRDVRFEDQWGNEVLPGEPLMSVSTRGLPALPVPGDATPSRIEKPTVSVTYPFIENLFVVMNGLKHQIPPGGFCGEIRGFSYDAVSRRVCVGPGSEWIIYEIDSAERRVFPQYDPDERLFTEYYLIPGRDALIRKQSFRDEDGHSDVDWTLNLVDTDGNVIADIPTMFRDSLSKVKPSNITVTENLLLFLVSDGCRSAVKVFEVLEDNE